MRFFNCSMTLSQVRALALVCCLIVGTGGRSVEAGWLEDLRALGGMGRTAPASDPLEMARELIVPLKVRAPALVLAASVTAEGHWTFVNQAGLRFTAARPEEVGKVYDNLAPDGLGRATRPAPMVIYLAGEAVFSHGEHLRLLPSDAQLRVVVGGTSFPLRRFGTGGAGAWLAEVRANVFIQAPDETVFSETVWQLMRPLKTRGMRILRLDPAGPDTLRPRGLVIGGGAGEARRRVADAVKPERLAGALSSLRGQTAVLTGRLQGDDRLVFRTPTGVEQKLVLGPVRAAAAEADVNLVVVNASAPRQPGARNWLWLSVEVDGLADALRQERLGDFLNSVAGGRRRLLVRARTRGADRVTLKVLPTRAGVLEREPGLFDEVLSELGAEVVGSVIPHAVDADLVSRAQQRELDWRLVPGVPTGVQFGAGLALLAGIFGLPVALRWWRQIWPVEARADYAGRSGFLAARAVRLVVFALFFLPLIGVPALLWGVVKAGRRLFGGGHGVASSDRKA